jgi:hypothetical protein
VTERHRFELLWSGRPNGCNDVQHDSDGPESEVTHIIGGPGKTRTCDLRFSGNKPESFEGNFVVSDRWGLFFEVPFSLSATLGQPKAGF